MITQLRHRVREIIVETLSIDTDNLPDKLTADTVKQWDSLGHVRLIDQLENRFSLCFEQSQIPKLWSEDAIVDTVSELLNQDQG